MLDMHSLQSTVSVRAGRDVRDVPCGNRAARAVGNNRLANNLQIATSLSLLRAWFRFWEHSPCAMRAGADLYWHKEIVNNLIYGL